MTTPNNDPVLIKHTTSGAEVKVYPFGATVGSFVNSKNKEVLFVSKLAKTDGSKATRGGIPLVFPQFGQPNKDMPQHGFLRNNYWKTNTDTMYDNESSAGCEFTLALKDVVNSRGTGIWSAEAAEEDAVECTVKLAVKVEAMSFTTEMTVSNICGKPFDYQTLFHTYYKIYGSKALDVNMCNVVGLEGYAMDDKVTGEKGTVSADPIIIDRETDRIYTPPSDKPKLDVTIATGDDGSKVSVQASAVTKEGEVVPVSAVVWNPFINKSKGMSDFGDEEYHDMICVEPGTLSGMKALAPGSEVVFTQVIQSL